MVYIYVLQLEEGKYYIGKTNNPHFRIEKHFNSNGAVWTKIYKPVKLLELISNCDDYDEDKYTMIYMDKYGINNVRGGAFVSLKLDSSTINHLQKMSNATNNKCFNCGNKGHFAKYCNKNKISTSHIPLHLPSQATANEYSTLRSQYFFNSWEERVNKNIKYNDTDDENENDDSDNNSDNDSEDDAENYNEYIECENDDDDDDDDDNENEDDDET